jgi:hypothetical protein
VSRAIDPPSKPQLSISEAAKELNRTEADVGYYLSAGLLRYSVAARSIPFSASISLFGIYQLPQVSKLREQRRCSPEQCHSTFIKLEEMDTMLLEPGAPEYLYMSNNTQRLYQDENENCWAWEFYTFDGQPICLLTQQGKTFSIEGSYVGKLKTHDDGITTLEPAVISREELDSFIQTYKIDDSNEQISKHQNEIVEHQPKQLIGNTPFKPLERNNPAAEVIIHYGNEFYKLYKRLPKFPELTTYIAEYDNDHFGIKVKPESGALIIEDKEYSRDCLSRRFRKYVKAIDPAYK